MTIWLLAASMALVVAGVLIWSLWRQSKMTTDRREIDLAVFQDQLAEVDRDVARELIAPGEADAARVEISRRMLAQDRMAGPSPSPGITAKPWPAIAAVALIPIAAIALYAYLGAPNLGTAPKPSAEQTEMSKLVENLAVKMEGRPNDLDGFRLLARSAAGIGRYDLAIPAYRRAMELDGNKDQAIVGDFAEALVMSEHAVVPEARRAFDAVLASDPKDARARYYLAEAQAEIGAWDKALAMWQAIIADADPQADYVDVVRARIADAAKKLGRDPAVAIAGTGATPPSPQAVAPKPAPGPGSGSASGPGAGPGPGPSAEDVAAASKMAPADRQGMIETMVGRLADRLKTAPDDPAGWRKLARAYLVLGKADAALGAYEEAIKREPASIEGLTGYASALRQAAGPNDPRYAAALEKLVAADPDNAEALMALGERDLRAGRTADARTKWARLLSGLPKDEPQRKMILNQMRTLAAEAKVAPATLGLPD